jgi:hypothetical protein
MLCNVTRRIESILQCMFKLHATSLFCLAKPRRPVDWCCVTTASLTVWALNSIPGRWLAQNWILLDKSWRERSSAQKRQSHNVGKLFFRWDE